MEISADRDSINLLMEKKKQSKVLVCTETQTLGVTLCRMQRNRLSRRQGQELLDLGYDSRFWLVLHLVL